MLAGTFVWLGGGPSSHCTPWLIADKALISAANAQAALSRPAVWCMMHGVERLCGRECVSKKNTDRSTLQRRSTIQPITPWPPHVPLLGCCCLAGPVALVCVRACLRPAAPAPFALFKPMIGGRKWRGKQVSRSKVMVEQEGASCVRLLHKHM